MGVIMSNIRLVSGKGLHGDVERHSEEIDNLTRLTLQLTKEVENLRLTALISVSVSGLVFGVFLLLLFIG